MIDLHCHILPGVDDGPANLDFSLALARAAVESGIDVVAATPHVRSDGALDPARVEGEVDSLTLALHSAGVALRVVTGGEVTLERALELDGEQAKAVCLGDSSYLLVESPFSDAGPRLESGLYELQQRGLHPVLAHPERSRAFLGRPERLASLVAAGVLCSITAGSMAGRFGSPARRFSARLLERGLVHDVASDAHDHIFRPPDIREGFASMEELLPGIEEQVEWLTLLSPQAILSAQDPPPAPNRPSQGSRWRRLATPLMR